MIGTLMSIRKRKKFWDIHPEISPRMEKPHKYAYKFI